MTTVLQTEADGANGETSLANQSTQSLSSQMSDRSSQREASQESDESDNDEPGVGGASTHSRKEKSLGILCRRFLITMGESTRNGNDIHLETVAKHMSTEKRRIYDIVNVMEALEAMSKTNKSFYRWNTLATLPQLMHNLKNEAEVDDLPRRIKNVEGAMCSFIELGGAGRERSGRASNEAAGSATNSPLDGRATADVRKPKSSAAANSLRDRNGKNSLAQLCRRFLMVLLCNPDDKRKVSLDVASTVLIKEPESEGYDPPSRSRCRRLYDIANVLVAMGLIKKVHYLFGTKKIPLFVYCGPEPSETTAGALSSMSEFVKRSDLAQPNDATWLAIFGNPRPELPKVLRPLQNVASHRPPAVQPKATPPPAAKPPVQRRVLGELDPTNPRGPDDSKAFRQPFAPFGQPTKRTHDGGSPARRRTPRRRWKVVKTENDENSPAQAEAQRRGPLSSVDLENQPPAKRQSLSGAGAPFGAAPAMPPALPQFPNFSACLPNLPPFFNYAPNSAANNLQYLAAAMQLEELRKVLTSSAATSSAPSFLNAGTAFKPFQSSHNR
ncbi:hypothetical protein M3Y99_00164000 [Aphelenchoides fujianensis]|nr:hypothetical protein M3Y99_00164000 [Aphelenchoides fujianensis]